MEVRSGGGDRYGASWYSVPSTGAVCGVSSIELLVLLCGYLFVVWLFSVSVGLGVWPGRTLSSLLCFLSCQVLSACASGQAELSVSLSPSCVVVVVSRRLVSFLTCSWCCVGNSSRPLGASGVSVSMSVSGPVGLGLGFCVWFPWFCLLSVCLAGGWRRRLVVSAVLLRAFAVTFTLVCLQLSVIGLNCTCIVRSFKVVWLGFRRSLCDL